jgi:hypothetical protein
MSARVIELLASFPPQLPQETKTLATDEFKRIFAKHRKASKDETDRARKPKPQTD